MINKLIVALAFSTVSLSSIATDWRALPYANEDVKIYYDWQSLKDQNYDISYSESFRYFDVHFRLDYQTPQQLKSGKHYTREYHLLSVACEEQQYAKTDFEWYLNTKKTEENKEIALSAAWQDFTVVPHVRTLDSEQIKHYHFASIQSTAICEQLIG